MHRQRSLQHNYQSNSIRQISCGKMHFIQVHQSQTSDQRPILHHAENVSLSASQSILSVTVSQLSLEMYHGKHDQPTCMVVDGQLAIWITTTKQRSICQKEHSELERGLQLWKIAFLMVREGANIIKTICEKISSISVEDGLRCMHGKRN